MERNETENNEQRHHGVRYVDCTRVVMMTNGYDLATERYWLAVHLDTGTSVRVYGTVDHVLAIEDRILEGIRKVKETSNA